MGLDMRDLQQVLSDRMHRDADAAGSFVAGLRMYLDDDPYKVTTQALNPQPQPKAPNPEPKKTFVAGLRL